MCLGPEIMTALQAIGTVMSVAGAMGQGEQRSAYANYQADQAVADAQAERGAAQVRAEKLRKMGKAQQSEARASLAASGVETGAGTAVTIDKRIGANAELDAQTELLTGQNRAARLEGDAAAFRYQADQAKSAAKWNAATSLLAGGSKIAGGWKTGANTPGFQGDGMGWYD